MIAPIRLACWAVLAAVLAGCANKPVSEMPAAAAAATPAPAAAPAATAATPTPTPAAKPAAAAKPIAEKGDVTPMDRAEANAQCWMKYDKTNVSLEAKAKLVEKCSDEKMKGR
jgi:hypothetical protein